MAFSELEIKKIEQTVGRLCLKHSPPHLTQELRMEYQVKGHAVVIVEVRVRWNNAQEWGESPIAKLKFIRTVRQWQLYWKRANLKWYGYEPFFSSSDLAELVREIDADPHGCFFGEASDSFSVVVSSDHDDLVTRPEAVERHRSLISSTY